MFIRTSRYVLCTVHVHMCVCVSVYTVRAFIRMEVGAYIFNNSLAVCIIVRVKITSIFLKIVGYTASVFLY